MDIRKEALMRNFEVVAEELHVAILKFVDA
jgi:hypothetical protein